MSFLPKIRFLGKPAKKIFQLTFQVNIKIYFARFALNIKFCIKKPIRNSPLKQIGDRMGGLHYSAVSQIFIRLNFKSKEDNKFKKLLAKVDGMCNLSKIQTWPPFAFLV